jgi:hypothetical protein
MKKSVFVTILLVFTAASIHAQLADSIKGLPVKGFPKVESIYPGVS